MKKKSKPAKGRPPAKAKRTSRVVVLFSDIEREKADQVATARGQELSPLLRSYVLAEHDRLRRNQ